LPALTPEVALALFDAAVCTGEALTVPLEIDTAALRGRESVPALLRDIAGWTPRRGPANVAAEVLPRAEKPGGRLPDALRLVREKAAAVLGHKSFDAIPPTRAFVELGFDSMTSVELRNELSEVVGTRLPATLVFDYPDAQSVAEFLVQLTAGTPESTKEGAGPLTALFGQLCDEGQLEAALAVARECARPCRSSEELPLAEPVRLAARQNGMPEFVCLPSFITFGETYQYQRLAGSLQGVGGIVVQANPGFKQGEELPASVQAVARRHARSMAESGAILVGHSTGGLLAHAVAAELERAGQAAAGLVLLDTYLLAEAASGLTLGAVLGGMRERESDVLGFTDARLSAMAHYSDLFAGWVPQPVTTPTFFVSASEPVRGLPADLVSGEAWQATWPLAHTLAEAPGDHFTMVEEHAAKTGVLIRDWAATL